MPTIHPIALTCIALLGLLLFGLGLAVSFARRKSGVSMGVTEDHDHVLNRRVRAHGNTAEYAPFLALLFLIHGMRELSLLTLCLILGATAARYLIVLAMLTAHTVKRGEPLRFVGALGTYVCGLSLTALLLV